MPVRIGKIELVGLTHIYTEDHRRLVRQRAPGQAGAVFQDLGREPVTVVMEGVLLGKDTLEGLEQLRQAQAGARPLSFAANVVAGADFTQVLIADFQVKQLAGHASRYAFFLRVREYVEPPAPAEAGAAAVNEKVLSSAAAWNAGALGAASVLKNPKGLMAAVNREPSLLGHLSASQLCEVMDKAGDAVSGHDLGVVLKALSRVEPLKIVEVVASLTESKSLGEFIQKLATESVPLLEQMTGLELGAARDVVKALSGASDFLSKLNRVVSDGQGLARRLGNLDPLVSFTQQGGFPS